MILIAILTVSCVTMAVLFISNALLMERANFNLRTKMKWQLFLICVGLSTIVALFFLFEMGKRANKEGDEILIQCVDGSAAWVTVPNCESSDKEK